MKNISFANKFNDPGKPSSERILAFKNFFMEITNKYSANENFKSNYFNKFYMYFFPRNKFIFISMPPFRKWGLFFNPFNKIILDIRDGWSIAIATGYGGTVKPRPLKAKLARLIEKIAIRRSLITISCTNGLATHLENISGKPILLIPNGISTHDLDLIKKIRAEKESIKNENEICFVCAGQFSEYGSEKAIKLLNVIFMRYSGKKILKIKLIGCNPRTNDWVAKYFNELTSGKGIIEIMPRMDREEMYRIMINCDYGISIIRDPSYDFGTKVFDYIGVGLPLINYFNERNNFTDYFDAYLDIPFTKNAPIPEIRRNVLIENAFTHIKWQK